MRGLFKKHFNVFNTVYLSRSALLHNFDIFQSLQPNNFVIPVLKSNAYGHGIIEIATILKQRTFPYIAVDGYYERLAIQRASKQPVLVMGAIEASNFQRMNFHRTAFVVHDEPTVRALARTRRKVKVHIEIETGMVRHGVSLGDLPEFLTLLAQYPTLHVEGVMTHLADADNPENTHYSERQTRLFDQAVALVREAGFTPTYIHIAQSAGSVKITSRTANTTRIGLALYGINPLEVGDKFYKKLRDLRPVLSLTSTITSISPIKKGSTISYGRTYTAPTDTLIGVLPLGYYEGVPRSLSNVGSVAYKTHQLSIAGRVCMNHTMIDISQSGAQVGDTVTVISSDPNSTYNVVALCRTHHLFMYGLLVGLNEHIRRSIVR